MKTTVRSPNDLDAFLDRLLQADLTFDKHGWDIEVTKHDGGISAAQRRQYWKWVNDIGNHLGYFKDEMHEELKEAHMIPIEYTGLDGTIKERRPSITKLKVKEMSEYMDKVYTWAGTMGIFLSRPEDMHAR